MQTMKQRCIRCDDTIWLEAVNVAKSTNQDVSSLVRAGLVEKIQKIKRENFLKGEADWFIARERKLQTIEQYFKDGRVDLDKLTELVMYDLER